MIVKQQTNAKNDQAIQRTDQAIQRLEAQIVQMVRELSERKKGELLAQTIPNPGCHQKLKAVIALKNGKIIGVDEPVQASPNEASTSKVSEMEKVNGPPFPQRLVKPKKKRKLLDIFKTLGKIEINILLLDAIQQILAYAKFLKDFCIHKKKS